MSVAIDIVLNEPELSMYGEPDTSSAYSLSGHVSLTLHSPFTLPFQTPRPARVLLQSLEVLFEGQSEIVSPELGYSTFRICSVTRELVQHSFELNNIGREGATEPSTWNVVFDIPIPGWLPTCTMGSSGDSYRLYATATLLSLEEPVPSWFGTICSSFMAREWKAEAARLVAVRRYLEPPSDLPREPKTVNYTVKTRMLKPQPKDALRIPKEIIAALAILVTVPKFTDVESQKIDTAIRLRMDGLDAEVCQRLRLKGITVDIVQTEKTRMSPTEDYRSSYPVPDASLQPPNLPLRHVHPLRALYLTSAPDDADDCHAFSLLPPGEKGSFKLAGDSNVFVNNTDSPVWYTLKAGVPFERRRNYSIDEDNVWADTRLQPSSTGPLCSFRHEFRITLNLSFDLEDGAVATEQVILGVPLNFVQLAKRLQPLTPEQLNGSGTVTRPLSFSRLPVYSELYDKEGERKLDPTPLPVYTPRGVTPPTVIVPVYSPSTPQLVLKEVEQAPLVPDSVSLH